MEKYLKIQYASLIVIHLGLRETDSIDSLVG